MSAAALALPMTTPFPRHIELGDLRLWLAEPSMCRLYDLLARMAIGHLPIVIYGETGAGKEIMARAAHAMSPRRQRPLVSINCAAIPEGLAEAELFGHDRGAFTGSVGARAGLLESANGGIVFLDEIGELSLATQARLLRAIDARRITRVGSTAERPIDIRIIAATNRDLHQDMLDGRFREDLYFRLSGASITVPPLRDRPRDLPHLARDLLTDACRRLGRDASELTDAALTTLLSYPWPGNVRELRHAMDYAATVSAGAPIDVVHLPPHIVARVSATRTASDPSTPPVTFLPIADELRTLERLRMHQALTATAGNQSRAAALLHMPRRTFLLKMKAYTLVSANYRPRRRAQ